MARQTRLMAFAEGVGMGAGLTYFLDPRLGRTRRTRVKDKLIHVGKETEKFAEGVRADLAERRHGWIPKLRHAIRLDAREDVEDRVLVQRVRAKIGKHVTHPASLKVHAASGKVTLTGPILADEVEEAVRVVRRIPGVKEVENLLETHTDPEGVPGLEGGESAPSHEKPEILRDTWSPSLRLLVGLLGISAIAGSAKLAGPGRLLLLGAGSILLFRNWRNRPLF